ncbi:MAG TPA: CHAT domain-containing tetratricopeptide repeat protein [Solirubrobacteraceae bacterium]|nr:CHAT domain-containing tetratricopeptide repeat protein [Solirubrobacteraceae bacterium]
MPALPKPLIDAMDTFAVAHDRQHEGNYKQALAGFDEVLTTFKDQGLLLGVMPCRAYHGRAAALMHLGELDEALAACGRAMAVLGPPGGELDDTEARGAVLNTTGQILRGQGKLNLAAQAYGMAIEHLREHPGDLLASTLSNIGALASHNGDNKRALIAYEEALDVLDAHCPDSPQRGHLLVNLAGALKDDDQPDAAITQLAKALELLRQTGQRGTEATALLALSRLYASRHDPKQSHKRIHEAETIARQLAPRGELHARCVRQHAELDLADGDLPAAAARLADAAGMIRSFAPVSRDAIDTGRTLAAILVALDDLDGAVREAQVAVSSAEQLRGHSAPGTAREQIARVTAAAHDALAFCLIRRNLSSDRRRLVDLLEQRRARRLLDTLGAGRLTPPENDPRARAFLAIRAEARRAQQQLHALRTQLAMGAATPLGEEDLMRLEVGARQRLLTAESELAREGRISDEELLDCSAIQGQLSDTQAILQCVVTPMLSAILTITASTITVREIADVPAQLDGPVRDIANAAASGRTPPERTIGLLSAALLEDLPDVAMDVIVIADGPLYRLPWALLEDEQHSQPLGIARNLAHAQSLTSWFSLARHNNELHPARDLLALGDPTYTAEQISDARLRSLDGTAKEITALAQLVDDTTVLHGEDATEARLVEQLPHHRRAHIACHGILDQEDASHSALLLAPPRETDSTSMQFTDDRLEAWEIEDLAVACDTVILSACSTAAGDMRHGEGLIGLTHALHIAGVRQVISALWPVGDEATARIMQTLYTHLASGQPLQEAIRQTRADHQHESPKHWAAWTVSGPSSGT